MYEGDAKSWGGALAKKHMPKKVHSLLAKKIKKLKDEHGYLALSMLTKKERDQLKQNEGGFKKAQNLPSKQKKAVEDMVKKGFNIVIWEVEYVAMMDKKGNPAEVYPDGTVKYPKKR
jgi:hypothetical protein